MRPVKLSLTGFVLAGFVLSAGAADSQVRATKAVLGNWGVDLSGMDRTVAPGDDFFRYVNGGWFSQAVIPSDRTATGSFVDLDIQSEDRLRGILNSLEARKDSLTGDEKKIRDLYHSYLDTDRIEQLGLAPAQKDIAVIAALKTHEDVARIMASPGFGVQSLFSARVGVDDKNPNAYAVFLRQSGLGLPDRDYYLRDEKGIVAAREAYRPYIAQMLRLGGIAGEQAKAEGIFKLETEIAKLHWTRVERRDADKTYNPMAVSELAGFAPNFPWVSFLREGDITTLAGRERRVIVSENTAFPKLAALFAQTPVEVWRDYVD